MPLTTSGIGIDQAGSVFLSAGSTVSELEKGAAVTYGDPQTIASGETLPVGTWEVQSGTLVADGAVTVVPVTIVT